jgi:hypothetical protein
MARLGPREHGLVAGSSGARASIHSCPKRIGSERAITSKRREGTAMRYTMATLLVIGCTGRHNDAQPVCPKPAAQPASTAASIEPSADLNSGGAAGASGDGTVFLENALAHFRAEPVDSAWAPTTQSFLQGEIDKVALQFPATVRAGRVECRRKTCLLEISHPDESTLVPVNELLSPVHIAAKRQGGPLAMAFHPWKNSDGSITERIYFAYAR